MCGGKQKKVYVAAEKFLLVNTVEKLATSSKSEKDILENKIMIQF